MQGLIHSKESFGTVDGPGIRYVLFMQGCPLRCAYCHNPDTWQIGTGEVVNASDIIAEVLHNRAFYRQGGLTVSGGEPLLQAEFVTELFRLAHQEGIHTCLDTSGIVFCPQEEERIGRLLDHTDLVMLDIKHIDDEVHRRLTGASNRNVLAFARFLESRRVPVWIRHVVVPGHTDSPEALAKLGHFIGSLTNLKALDVIPYHTMGVVKYKELGLPYPLEEVSPATAEEAGRAKALLLQAIQEARANSSRS